jgi:hypothetical protein
LILRISGTDGVVNHIVDVTGPEKPRLSELESGQLAATRLTLHGLRVTAKQLRHFGDGEVGRPVLSS